MLDQVRQRLGVLAAPLLSLLVAASLLVSLFLLAYHYDADPAAFNADNLLSSAQCDDLLHGREVTDWHLPGAPYVFPDLLILVPCQALAPTLPVAFLTYCFVIHLSMTAVLFWLGRLSGLGRHSAWCAAGCGVILLVDMHLGGAANWRSLLLVHPGSHVSAILVGLFLLALTVHMLRRGLSWTTAILYVLVAALGGFSDRLVLVQFAAPLGLALVVMAAGRMISLGRASSLLALLGASILLATAIKALFTWAGFHFLVVDTSFGKLHLPDLFRMLRALYRKISEEHLLCELILLQLVTAFFVAWMQARRSAAPSEETRLDRQGILLASGTLLLSPACILGTLYIAGMHQHPAIERYTLSCWFLPALSLPLLLCWLPGRTARMGQALLQLAILVFAMQRATALVPGIDRTKFEQPYPPLAQALDQLARERGPVCGLSGFWSARATGFFSREHVAINVLSAQGEPWFHASNPASFLPDNGKDLHVPDYRFLVVRPGEPFAPASSVLALHFGEPIEKIALGNDQIWLYDSLRVPTFERFLRSRLAERLCRLRPYTGPIEPASLARPKANMTPDEDPGNIALEPDQSCEVRFARPITGRLLDVGASFDSRLELDFFHGAKRQGSLTVPPVPWTGACYEKAGIQSRLLPLPPALRDHPWDRIVVRSRPNGENVRLGHVLVFAEGIPELEKERPAPPFMCLRLESEEMMPLNPGTPFTDDADPAASGGRARRAVVDYRCCFSFTPRLFLLPGRYRLECALKVDDNTASSELAALLVCSLSPPAPLAERSLRGSDFETPGHYVRQTLRFEVPEETEGVQIGVVSAGKTPITLDYMELIAETADSSASNASAKRP
jgi:hypothetical protein